ncbi:Uncharacterised protein [Vibrio cholerae]|nr:Uncharacterised protein [Vibrio cholerae]
MPSFFALMMCSATVCILSIEPTEVPPNFCTIRGFFTSIHLPKTKVSSGSNLFNLHVEQGLIVTKIKPSG